MPLDRLVIIIVCVLAAAGVTVWAAALLFAGISISPSLGLLAAIPVGLLGYIVLRVLLNRFTSKEDVQNDQSHH